MSKRWDRIRLRRPGWDNRITGSRAFWNGASLLALALIIGVAIGLALMLHNRAPQSDRTTTSPTPMPRQAMEGGYSQSGRCQCTAAATAENQNLTAYRYSAAGSASGVIGNADQRSTSASAAPQPITTDSPRRWNVPAEANQPAGGGASGLNTPAGANMPAKLNAPPNVRRLLIQRSLNPAPIFRRPITRTANCRRRAATALSRESVVALQEWRRFNGNISNPPRFTMSISPISLSAAYHKDPSHRGP